jgi:hypothetical protein
MNRAFSGNFGNLSAKVLGDLAIDRNDPLKTVDPGAAAAFSFSALWQSLAWFFACGTSTLMRPSCSWLADPGSGADISTTGSNRIIEKLSGGSGRCWGFKPKRSRLSLYPTLRYQPAVRYQQKYQQLASLYWMRPSAFVNTLKASPDRMFKRISGPVSGSIPASPWRRFSRRT